MKLFKAAALAALLVSFAAPADLVKYKDWEKSVECQLLATDAEKKAWKAVKTDEDAEKFVGLFWAKRNPDLKNPNNDFKMMFEARAKKADEVFTVGKKRGALSERGKVVILVGPPKAMTRRASDGAAPGSTGASGIADLGGDATFEFTFDEMPKWSDMRSWKVSFVVNQSTGTESTSDPSTVRKLAAKAVQAALANPDLKTLPIYKTAQEVEAERKAALDAQREAAKGAVLSAPVKTVLEGILAGQPVGAVAAHPIAYRDGATVLMIQLFMPAAMIPTAEGAKLGLLVKDSAGVEVARREEAAGLQVSKGDYFVDRSVQVAPGDYVVAIAVMDASGAVLASGKKDAKVEPLPKEFGVSPLVISCNDMPADGAKLDDPFTFSARKFVVKGEKLDGKNDGLSYAVRIYNPWVDPETKKIKIKRTVKLKTQGRNIDVPQAADDATPAPEFKDGNSTIVIDLAANIVDTSLWDYMRGECTLIVTVEDGKNPPQKVQAKFTVTEPPKAAAPAKPAPAPKKKG